MSVNFVSGIKTPLAKKLEAPAELAKTLNLDPTSSGLAFLDAFIREGRTGGQDLTLLEIKGYLADFALARPADEMLSESLETEEKDLRINDLNNLGFPGIFLNGFLAEYDGLIHDLKDEAVDVDKKAEEAEILFEKKEALKNLQLLSRENLEKCRKFIDNNSKLEGTSEVKAKLEAFSLMLDKSAELFDSFEKLAEEKDIDSEGTHWLYDLKERKEIANELIELKRDALGSVDSAEVLENIDKTLANFLNELQVFAAQASYNDEPLTFKASPEQEKLLIVSAHYKTLVSNIDSAKAKLKIAFSALKAAESTEVSLKLFARTYKRLLDALELAANYSNVLSKTDEAPALKLALNEASRTVTGMTQALYSIPEKYSDYSELEKFINEATKADLSRNIDDLKKALDKTKADFKVESEKIAEAKKAPLRTEKLEGKLKVSSQSFSEEVDLQKFAKKEVFFQYDSILQASFPKILSSFNELKNALKDSSFTHADLRSFFTLGASVTWEEGLSKQLELSLNAEEKPVSALEIDLVNNDFSHFSPFLEQSEDLVNALKAESYTKPSYLGYKNEYKSARYRVLPALQEAELRVRKIVAALKIRHENGLKSPQTLLDLAESVRSNLEKYQKSLLEINFGELKSVNSASSLKDREATAEKLATLYQGIDIAALKSNINELNKSYLAFVSNVDCLSEFFPAGTNASKSFDTALSSLLSLPEKYKAASSLFYKADALRKIDSDTLDNKVYSRASLRDYVYRAYARLEDISKTIDNFLKELENESASIKARFTSSVEVLQQIRSSLAENFSSFEDLQELLGDHNLTLFDNAINDLINKEGLSFVQMSDDINIELLAALRKEPEEVKAKLKIEAPKIKNGVQLKAKNFVETKLFKALEGLELKPETKPETKPEPKPEPEPEPKPEPKPETKPDPKPDAKLEDRLPIFKAAKPKSLIPVAIGFSKNIKIVNEEQQPGAQAKTKNPGNLNPEKLESMSWYKASDIGLFDEMPALDMAPNHEIWFNANNLSESKLAHQNILRILDHLDGVDYAALDPRDKEIFRDDVNHILHYESAYLINRRGHPQVEARLNNFYINLAKLHFIKLDKSQLAIAEATLPPESRNPSFRDLEKNLDLFTRKYVGYRTNEVSELQASIASEVYGICKKIKNKGEQRRAVFAEYNSQIEAENLKLKIENEGVSHTLLLDNKSNGELLAILGKALMITTALENDSPLSKKDTFENLGKSVNAMRGFRAVLAYRLARAIEKAPSLKVDSYVNSLINANLIDVNDKA